jgi:hypothetical protein
LEAILNDRWLKEKENDNKGNDYVLFNVFFFIMSIPFSEGQECKGKDRAHTEKKWNKVSEKHLNLFLSNKLLNCFKRLLIVMKIKYFIKMSLIGQRRAVRKQTIDPRNAESYIKDQTRVLKTTEK